MAVAPRVPLIEDRSDIASLRTQDWTRTIPVVVVTEDDSPPLIAAAETPGTSASMVKARTLRNRLAEAVLAALSPPRRSAGTSKAS